MTQALCPPEAAAAVARPGPTRRRLLAAGAACAATLARPWVARAATQSLKIAFLFSKNSQLVSKNSQLGAGAGAFADEVAKRTDRRYTIEQFPDAVLGGELEMLDGVAKGEIDLAFITGAPLANLVPEHGIFDVPFLFRDTAHAHAVLDSPIGHEYLEMFRPKEMVALAWGENGMRHLTNSRRPVRTPEDVRGLHLRVPQSPIMVKGFEALGAHPEPLAFPALYGALESGRFDGQENPIATIEAAKFARVQKHLSLTGHIYSTAIIFMSPDAWEDLAAADKAAFAAASRAGGLASRQFAAKAQQDGVKRLADQGMQVVSDIDRATFVAALAPAPHGFAQTFGPDRVERIKSVGAA